MNAEQVHAVLVEKCLPRMEAYQDDLLKHDLAGLKEAEAIDGTLPQFFHVTRDWGTYLDIMYPVAAYPAEGVKIPYLFGHVNRIQLLDTVGEQVAWCRKNHPEALVLHYDGQKVREITYQAALDTVATYKRTMLGKLRGRKVA